MYGAPRTTTADAETAAARRQGRIMAAALEAADGNAGPAQRAVALRIVVRRLVFGEGDVRDLERRDRFHAIVDFRRGDDLAAALPYQLRALHERLPGIPHIVHDQDFAAAHLLLVEAAQRLPAVDVDGERREDGRRPGDGAAAVE